MAQSHLKQNKTLFLKEKSQLSLQQCFKRCIKNQNDYKSFTSRQISCVQYCSTKYTNAYSFAFDVIVNNGIYRLPQKQLANKQLK